MKIAGREITRDGDDAFIIAEIGHNHQGNLGTCIKLFEAAADCGVDAVKLQKRDNKALYTDEMYSEPYNSENAYAPTYGAHRERLEFGRDEYLHLKMVAEQLGLIFFATAFDIPSVDFLEEIDLPAYKVGSGDLTNVPLINHIASKGKPIFISTGGAKKTDIFRAHSEAINYHDNICIMQCTSGYPAPMEELNLKVIEQYRKELPFTVIGLSDHHHGILTPVLGYMLGARVFEKHFTLNRSWKGTDQSFSLEPAGMKKMVRDIRSIPVALGDGVKKQYESEVSPLRKMGKMIIAKRDMKAGDIITDSDIECKSPCDGLPPYWIPGIVGRKLALPLHKGEPFTQEGIAWKVDTVKI